MRPTISSLTLLVGLSSLLIVGCTPAPQTVSGTSSPADGKGGSGTTAGQVDTTKETQCAELLESLLGQYSSPQVVMNFDPGQALSLMNQWGRTCRPELPSPATEVTDQWSEYLDPQLVQSLRDGVYTLRDADHLQTCVWMNIVKQHVTAGATEDLNRVVALFDYVVRNVTLVAEHPEETPFSVKTILVSGEGTIEDRAWLFAELLKQLKIDVVFIAPEQTAESEDGIVPQLIGVLVGGETYLFDPQLGIPVPASSEKIVPGKPYEIATLKQVLAKPETLSRLHSKDHPHPLNAETLPKTQLYLYGTSSWWAPRLFELSEHFIGGTQSEVYDGLTDLNERRGLLTRLKAYADPSISGAGFKVWGYPEQQLKGQENLNSLQQQVMTRTAELYRLPWVKRITGGDAFGTFDDPTNRNSQKKAQQVTMEPSGEYYRGRSEQILGDYPSAVRTLMNNQRNSRVFQDVDDPRLIQQAEFSRMRQSHLRVMNDATYWTAVCKLEQRTPESIRIAQDKFNQYVREYSEGNWASSSHYQLALLFAREGKIPEAVEHLKKIPASDLLAPSAAWLIAELGGAEPEQKDKAAEASPPVEPTKPEAPSDENPEKPTVKPQETEKPKEEAKSPPEGSEKEPAPSASEAKEEPAKPESESQASPPTSGNEPTGST